MVRAGAADIPVTSETTLWRIDEGTQKVRSLAIVLATKAKCGIAKKSYGRMISSDRFYRIYGLLREQTHAELLPTRALCNVSDGREKADAADHLAFNLAPSA